MAKKKTRSNGSNDTILKTIISVGRKDVNMSLEQAKNINKKVFGWFAALLLTKLLYYLGIAALAVWVIKSLFR